MNFCASLGNSGIYDLDRDEKMNIRKIVQMKLKKKNDAIAEEVKKWDDQAAAYMLIWQWLKEIEGKSCTLETKDLLTLLFFKITKSIDFLYSDNFDCKNLTPKFTVGKQGNKSEEFFRPWGIHADFTGRILVADRMNHRIQIFSQTGEFLSQFGEEGTGYGQFRRPTGVVVDKDWRIIVADKDNHRIQIFTFSGAFWSSFGRRGSEPGEFIYPWDVAVNSNCQIAVSDTKNHRVQLFDSRGKFLNIIHFKKDIPRGLAFRPDDCLLVTSFEKHSVIIFNKNLKYCGFFGRKGNGKGEFFRPQGVTCDESGRIAVSDSKNYRIQIFDPLGKFFKMIGIKGNAPGEFDCPQGISFHPNGTLLVTDLNNHRIQAF